jgi:hypothetical protein
MSARLSCDNIKRTCTTRQYRISHTHTQNTQHNARTHTNTALAELAVPLKNRSAHFIFRRRFWYDARWSVHFTTVSGFIFSTDPRWVIHSAKHSISLHVWHLHPFLVIYLFLPTGKCASVNKQLKRGKFVFVVCVAGCEFHTPETAY